MPLLDRTTRTTHPEKNRQVPADLGDAVLRVTTLYASSAAATSKYYTRYVTDAPGEVPGQWTGQQARRISLTDIVSTEALELLLSGHDPVSGVLLGYPLVDRSEEAESKRGPSEW
jgi:hypothetical protein